MHIFVYEFLTGGGLLHAGGTTAHLQSLYGEGEAMLAALAGDFAALSGVEVTILRDARSRFVPPPGVVVREVASMDAEREAFRRAAAEADWTVVIAPESKGWLVDRCALVTASGGRFLGVSGQALEITCDKHATAEFLRAAGLSAPRGWAIDAEAPWPIDLRFPAVIKPRDGAGSQGVRLLRSKSERLASSDERTSEATISRSSYAGFRVEQFCPGEPVSVALLCGPTGRFALPACRQRLSDDGRFEYLGGSLPLPPALAGRATRLAERAVAALPKALGYVGVDMVLGAEADGAGDFVIEINPRLTTSYIGLRAAASENLAAALLEVAEGRVPRLSFAADRVEFNAIGQVRVGAPAPSVR